MPGRMESVENLSRQQYRVRGAVDGFPPFPPPLGNRYAIPTVPQPRRRRYLSYEQETQGDTSIELPRGTFLLGVDTTWASALQTGSGFARLSRSGRSNGRSCNYRQINRLGIYSTSGHPSRNPPEAARSRTPAVGSVPFGVRSNVLPRKSIYICRRRWSAKYDPLPHEAE